MTNLHLENIFVTASPKRTVWFRCLEKNHIDAVASMLYQTLSEPSTLNFYYPDCVSVDLVTAESVASNKHDVVPGSLRIFAIRDGVLTREMVMALRKSCVTNDAAVIVVSPFVMFNRRFSMMNYSPDNSNALYASPNSSDWFDFVADAYLAQASIELAVIKNRGSYLNPDWSKHTMI